MLLSLWSRNKFESDAKLVGIYFFHRDELTAVYGTRFVELATMCKVLHEKKSKVLLKGLDR